MKKHAFICFLIICFSFLITPNASAFYDTFDTAPIDKNKWRWYEAVRNVSEGKLHLSVQSCDKSTVEAIPTAEAFSYMKANIIIDSSSYSGDDGAANVRLKGEFYNDTRGPGSGQDYNGYEGEIRAEIFIVLTETGGLDDLKSKAQVWRFDEADHQGQHTGMFSEYFTTSLQFDTEHELSIEFTGTSFVFKCNSETLTYPVSGPIYPSYTKLRVIDSKVKVNTMYTEECGYFKVKVDDFYNNESQTAYDTFDGDQLDANKWRYGEFIREIDNRKLRMKVERCDARGNNYSSPIATNDSGYLEAKVAINSGSASAGRNGTARIGSYLYNEKRGPGSGQDHDGYLDGVFVYNQLRIDESGNLKAYAGAWRSDHPDEESGTSLLWEQFDLPIELGKEYTLSIRLIGSKIIYKCNAKKIIFEIQTPTYEPYDKHYYLNSRINNSDQQCGFIDTTYDNIQIKPSLASLPACNFILLGN